MKSRPAPTGTIHPTQKRISSNIIKLLTDREMTRAELADRIGFSSAALVTQRLTGRSEWKPQQLEAVAEALGVEVGDLYDQLQLVPAGRHFDGAGTSTVKLPRVDSNHQPAVNVASGMGATNRHEHAKLQTGDSKAA
jgi:DNA-binding Xre family transcriptional regulator